MHREFHIGEKMFLKVKGRKKFIRPLGNCKKLDAIFYGPFEVLRRIGLVAYDISLPPTVKVQNYFHVSLLKKYVYDSNHMLDFFVIHIGPEGEPSTTNLHIG